MNTSISDCERTVNTVCDNIFNQLIVWAMTGRRDEYTKLVTDADGPISHFAVVLYNMDSTATMNDLRDAVERIKLVNPPNVDITALVMSLDSDARDAFDDIKCDAVGQPFDVTKQRLDELFRKRVMPDFYANDLVYQRLFNENVEQIRHVVAKGKEFQGDHVLGTFEIGMLFEGAANVYQFSVVVPDDYIAHHILSMTAMNATTMTQPLMLLVVSDLIQMYQGTM